MIGNGCHVKKSDINAGLLLFSNTGVLYHHRKSGIPLGPSIKRLLSGMIFCYLQVHFQAIARTTKQLRIRNDGQSRSFHSAACAQFVSLSLQCANDCRYLLISLISSVRSKYISFRFIFPSSLNCRKQSAVHSTILSPTGMRVTSGVRLEFQIFMFSSSANIQKPNLTPCLHMSVTKLNHTPLTRTYQICHLYRAFSR